MFHSKIAVNVIKGSGMKVPLSTLFTDFRFHVFDNVELALQPMLAFDLLFLSFTTTEFTNHKFFIKAYTVIMMRLVSSLNLQMT